jgi:hypothetical protein
MKQRVVALVDTDGHLIRSMDISDLDNASCLAVMTLEVQTQCDMGDWHQGQQMRLVPWGRRIAP